MDDLTGGHITLSHMYGRMQEYDPSRISVVWLWTVDCEVFVNCMLTCCREQTFFNVHRVHRASKKWMGHSGSNM